VTGRKLATKSAIQRQLQHKSFNATAGYIRDGRLFKGSSASCANGNCCGEAGAGQHLEAVLSPRHRPGRVRIELVPRVDGVL
jgi:hypothetical protein